MPAQTQTQQHLHLSHQQHPIPQVRYLVCSSFGNSFYNFLITWFVVEFFLELALALVGYNTLHIASMRTDNYKTQCKCVSYNHVIICTHVCCYTCKYKDVLICVFGCFLLYMSLLFSFPILSTSLSRVCYTHARHLFENPGCFYTKNLLLLRIMHVVGDPELATVQPLFRVVHIGYSTGTLWWQYASYMVQVMPLF